jgi:hypothetical protein
MLGKPPQLAVSLTSSASFLYLIFNTSWPWPPYARAPGLVWFFTLYLATDKFNKQLQGLSLSITLAAK